MRKMIELECGHCHKLFERFASEHKRNIKRGRPVYCSRSCVGKSEGVQKIKQYSGKTGTTQLNPANRRDKYTGLRVHLSRAKTRNQECTITLEELEEQWIKQEGKCKYSGVSLEHPGTRHKNNDRLRTSSLDRIDSQLGYVKGNVQFVSMAANWAKNAMSDDEMIAFCKSVAQHHM